MKPEIKDMWIKALESGEYKKGIESLKCGNEYCCLGVLQDLYNKSTGEGSPFDDGHDALGYIQDKKILEWAGVCESRLKLHEDDGYDIKIETDIRTTKNIKIETIATLNDFGPNWSKDFSDVIPIIREQL